MASFEIAISIKNKILADVLNKYKAVINQDYFPYGNCSEIDVTIDGDVILMSQNGADRTLDPKTPSALESLVYVLINFLDQGETDAAANLDIQVKDDGVNPENLNVEKYGPIGQLYKELYEKEEEIIRQMVSVNWSSNVEDWEEEFFAEKQQFTFDLENGENYTHELE